MGFGWTGKTMATSLRSAIRAIAWQIRASPAVEAFAAVTRHQDHSFARDETFVEDLLDPRSQLRPAVQQSRHPQQGVDPGIAGHDDPVATNSFV
jgi:hypothetical protein